MRILTLILPQVIQYYTEYEMNVRIYILSVLPPLIALGLIPNLKALAPFSTAANVLIASGLGITMYYMVNDMKYTVSDLPQITDSVGTLPTTFSITVFAMEAIGLVCSTPPKFIHFFCKIFPNLYKIFPNFRPQYFFLIFHKTC